MRSRAPTVLAYHAVSDEWRHALAISRSMLLRHVRLLLARRFEPVTLEQALSRRGRLFHVSFDDAFRSVATVLGDLRRLGVPVTVFACSALAEDGAPLDVPELSGELASHRDELLTMDWQSLREIADGGVAIGSHTMSHPHLTAVSDAQLERELRESRERFEAELSTPCTFLSYPYGEQDARVRAAARAAGYRAAVALPGIERPLNRFAFPRVGIYRRDGVARATVKTSALRRPAKLVTSLRG